MYNKLNDEQTAFMARLNAHPRGLPGINERFDKDSFVEAICEPLISVFTEPKAGEKTEKLNTRIKTFSRSQANEKTGE